MSYQALYRQFRPRRFADIAGQDHVTSVLKGQIVSDRVAHAYLFSGPRGNGKTSTARVFANAVNCSDPVQGEPCGTCPFCLAVGEGTASDIVEIDAASNRGIDEIRELRNRIAYLPALGRRRVYIIDEVHMLTTEAFNALLKTLEEPPSHILFIMATTEPSRLPATVLSRCQRFEFRRLTETVIADRISLVLGELGRQADPAAIELIASAADGALRDALSILDKALGYAPEGTLGASDVRACLGISTLDGARSLAAAIISSSPSDVLSRINTLIDSGVSPVNLTLDLIGVFRELLVFHNAQDAAAILKKSQDQLDEYARIAVRVPNDYLISCVTTLSATRRDARLIPDPRYLLECAALTLCDRDAVLEGYSIKSRLERLEARLDALASQPRAASPAPVQVQSNAPAREEASPQETQSSQGSQNPQAEASVTGTTASQVESLDEMQGLLSFAGKYILNKEKNIMLGDMFPKFKAVSFDGNTLGIIPTGDAVHMMSLFEKRGGYEKLAAILAERLGRPIQAIKAIAVSAQSQAPAILQTQATQQAPQQSQAATAAPPSIQSGGQVQDASENLANALPQEIPKEIPQDITKDIVHETASQAEAALPFETQAQEFGWDAQAPPDEEIPPPEPPPPEDGGYAGDSEISGLSDTGEADGNDYLAAPMEFFKLQEFQE